MAMLQRYPNIDAFFGRADALALGAAHAVKVAPASLAAWANCAVV
jgi:ABC-type sugar transport system substrate-binding protein